MSAPRLISPMLDGCIIGEAISCHNGIRCCPALRESTGEKYIVKIISIPASQIQLEALLLTGAYRDHQAALDYFMELAQDILKDKQVLSTLSRMEGFTPYLDAQVVPMEDGIGYEVYLLSPYKRSVEKLLASDTMTHLGVMNLGLDLCAALAACRRAGYLYVDLKPSNIFLTEQGDYRIGDLGFVNLASLKYTSLPDKYSSEYTAPEVKDPMAVLHNTVDIYALGLVLYQAYNGGSLPEKPAIEGLPFPPPMYADYEMAEIILKACSLDPKERWQDPTQMGQALVGYMQRNSVNDTPIIPPVLEPEAEEPEEAEEVEEFLPEQEVQPEELEFMQELVSDETAPSEENTEYLQETAVTEETSEMLAKADDLINHEIPEPVVAPEPIEVPMPAPLTEENTEEDSQAPEEAEPEAEPEETEESDQPEPEEAEKPATPVKPGKKKAKKSSKLTVTLILVASLLLVAGLGGWLFYEHYYLQNVDELIVTGTESMITVQVKSDIDPEKLIVYCSDAYGNTSYSHLVEGVAVFQQLNPQTRYTIRVVIDGFHQLTGMHTTSYTTAAQTEILTFDAAIGATDGSVLLSFTVGGQDCENWTVTYGADGIKEKEVAFTGHSVSIDGLTVGADYTFTLTPAEDLHLIGKTTVHFTASNILFAEDLTITACGDGKLTALWNAPEGITVGSWTIRCYNESGYDETVTTTDTTYTFTGLSHDVPCTVEVFAEGMNQSVFATIQANPVTITGFHYDGTDPSGLQITWDYSGVAPQGGWIIRYVTDGLQQQEVTVEENTASLFFLPRGHYEITIVAADGAPIFGGSTTYDMPEAPDFSGYQLTKADMDCKLCLRPQQEDWNWTDVAKDGYKTTFASGELAGMVIKVSQNYGVSLDNICIQYVLRDETGKLLQVDTQNIQWSYIWYSWYGEFNIPFMPQETGSYSLSIYFNGELVTVQNFSIA